MVTDGGPAYPRPPVLVDQDMRHGDYHWMQDGMSLRDHFAGLAMQSLISLYHSNDVDRRFTQATAAYDWADAMLAEKRHRERIDRQGETA